jgi:hypothetical protein
MHKIDGPGHVDNTFTEGNPTTGTPATVVTADWLNAVQTEIANVITEQGITLDKEDNTQLNAAIDNAINGAVNNVKQNHIIRFSLMGNVQLGANLLYMIAGVSGTVKSVVLRHAGTGTANVRVWGSGCEFFTGDVTSSSAEANDINEAYTKADWIIVDINSISGTVNNLCGAIIIEGA